MTEYALSAFGICAVVGVLSLLSYGSGRAESTALAVVCLFTLASPLIGAARQLDPEGLFEEIKIPDSGVESGYNQIIEEAFADGIASAVAEKFSINKGDVRVKMRNFDVENMRAESIRVILSGRGAFADSLAVEKYLNGLSVGECRVEIEIG